MTDKDFDAAIQLCDEVAKEKGWASAVKEFRALTGLGLKDAAHLAYRWGRTKND